MDEVAHEDVVYLAAFSCYNEVFKEKRMKKLKKRELFGKDRFKRKIWYLSQYCARDAIR